MKKIIAMLLVLAMALSLVACGGGEKEAAANKAIAESLTDDLLEYYYIQNWNGELPDTYVGSDDVSTIITGKTDN